MFKHHYLVVICHSDANNHLSPCLQLNSFSKLSKACKYFTTNYQGSRSEINKMTDVTII